MKNHLYFFDWTYMPFHHSSSPYDQEEKNFDYNVVEGRNLNACWKVSPTVMLLKSGVLSSLALMVPRILLELLSWTSPQIY
jgi:hypothetical protein